MNPYIGNEFQLYGVEEYTLSGGYKDNCKMLHVKNGVGLDMVISLDRNGDIVYLTYKGKNVSYITPNGVRHHSTYIPQGDGWIKNFTAGFLTTCGYENVGSPCIVDGKEYPLHGSINYIPVDSYSYEITDNEIIIKLIVLDEAIFSRKIKRERIITISLKENKFSIEDNFLNRGGEETPLEVLYHMNIGYPLVKEDSIIEINYDSIKARNKHSEEFINDALKLQKPTANFEEMCYFYHMKNNEGEASIYSPSEKFGLRLNYDGSKLGCFTEWKMMGIRDYVVGLEPGNVFPNGYKQNLEDGVIKFLKPDEKLTYKIDVTLFEE